MVLSLLGLYPRRPCQNNSESLSSFVRTSISHKSVSFIRIVIVVIVIVKDLALLLLVSLVYISGI